MRCCGQHPGIAARLAIPHQIQEFIARPLAIACSATSRTAGSRQHSIMPSCSCSIATTIRRVRPVTSITTTRNIPATAATSTSRSAGSGGSPEPGSGDRHGVPKHRRLAAELLPLAARVRRPEARPAKRFKDLERENDRLKRAVSELTLDKLILKEALEGKY